MKILLSADCFYPAPLGGPSNTIYWQAKALTQAGHEVSVVATSQALPASVPKGRWLSKDCGQVIYTRNPHFYVPLSHIWQGWRAMQQAEVVHVNSLFYPASIVWVLLSRLVGKPVVWSPHGELSPAALRYRRGLKKFIIRLVKELHLTIHFHATSQMEVACIQQHFGAGAAVTRIETRMELPEFILPGTSLPSPTPYVLFMGRIHPIKGIDRLIRALGQSSVFRGKRFRLIVAGPVVDKIYLKRLEKLVDELGLVAQVSFIGSVAGAQKEALYAIARVTILPSHAENFGNVVVESLAQGTPVVASANTPWQVLEIERTGRWVSNEPEPLQKAIDYFLTMPPVVYQAYRERAYGLARTRFDSRQGIRDWEQLYQVAMGGMDTEETVWTTAHER